MRAFVNSGDPGFQSWLEQRRRQGNDRFDEVWDGVLHVVPPPSSQHQAFESELEAVLRPIAKARGCSVFHNMGVYDPTAGEKNFRIPDLVVVDPKFVSPRGIEGRAELAVELLSPDDESHDKLPFYASCGIPELWMIDPITRDVEIYILRKTTYATIAWNRQGALAAPKLDLELQTVSSSSRP